ncbi:MAG TPA: transglutaminase-like cysteine peptidase [Ideonella sp.]|uniref:transglutaminase-like cysteine peptidase n=1 Tax=Ideonella sp. TaxID=1929293 RepID=UPI002E310A49|nr:transglutaminase-like cysteine peptidase [Ideonella sp.]HEX5684156.1 transglutaminase-like cysteine peptidase [Ideonella sp.]
MLDVSVAAAIAVRSEPWVAGAAVALRRALLHVRWATLLLVTLSLGVQAWDPARIVHAAARRGDQAQQGAQALRQAMVSVQSQDELSQLTAVNEFFNRRLQYRDDVDIWGQIDYWASPLESLQKGMADCEDYAIAKYFTLTALGMPHRKLRMVYVRAAIGGRDGLVQPHMVLAYYPNPEADPYVLDNLITELRRAGRRPDLSPVFSFNAEGLWEGVGPVLVGGAGPAERLSRWRDALAKARQDGFFQ